MRRARTTGDSPYLRAALSIARRLARAAVPATAGVTWLGDDLVGDDESRPTVVHRRVGADLYGGASGIAWFLANAAAYTGSQALSRRAVDGARHALDEAERLLEAGEVSLHAGATGVALAATEVGHLVGDAALRRGASALAARVAEAVVQGTTRVAGADLIGGLAGVAVGLLALHRRTGDAALLDACRAACRELVERRRREPVGCAWPDDATGPFPLCGLGHGATGIAWALAETSWATGDLALREVARDAFRYERSWFSAERCAWPDLRRPGGETQREVAWPGWTTAWCHGALGIGAVRLRCYEVDRDSTALAEASAAIQAARSLAIQAALALRRGEVCDVTLCHGLGGAAELALLAHEVLGLEEHRRAARRIGDLCLAAFTANGRRWPSGLRGARRVPGLLLGLAGIGTTMLRLHDPSLAGSPLLAGRAPLAAAWSDAGAGAQNVDCQASLSA